MQALTEIWNGLDTRRRGLLVGGAAAMVILLAIMIRLVSAPSYALLYSGLEPGVASSVITAVEARGIAYRVQGDAIHVDANHRDALRLTLAGEGLPSNGAAGYELLDQLSGFGTTSQMFDAAYWRAKEGELARTIVSSPRVRAARVHIANPGSDPFHPVQDVTASVAVRPAASGLAPGHPQALRYLVASSVPGLLPENVTIIDADSGQVLGGADMMSPAADAAGRAETLRQNIERLLAARVGAGNAVVQVSVEMTTARETILERRIDPDSRVVVGTDTEERSDSAQDSGGTAVTVASNLPDGDGAAGGGNSTSQTSETRERVTYDLSEIQREVEQAPGDIRRISVAVLLNGVTEVGADGIATIVPRTDAEVAQLQALVESAVGYDAERGDTVTIQSMAFDETVTGDLVAPSFTDRLTVDVGRIVQGLVLAAAALFIAFGLLRPMLRRDGEEVARSGAVVAPAPALANQATPVAAQSASLPSPVATQQTFSETPGDVALTAPVSGVVQPADQSEVSADPGIGLIEAPNPAQELDPVERLRRMIEEREAETVEILRGWMDADEEAPQ